MTVRHILLLLAIGVGSAILGYTFAHLLFAEPLIDFFAGTGTGEWERGVIGNWALHAICGGPLLVAVGSAFAFLLVIFDRFVKVHATLRGVLVAAFAFVAAFVGYFPLQVLLLLADAF